MANVYDRRSANFSNQEVQLLIQLINEHKNIIENNFTDGMSLQEKDKAWQLIHKVFNCSSQEVSRSVTHLKSKWSNLKKDARKYNAVQNKQKYITGGGPRKVHKNENCEMVISIIGYSVTGYNNLYDSDARMNKNKNCTVKNVLIDESEDDCPEKSTDNDVFQYCVKSGEIDTWSKWSKTSSKIDISPVLTNSINKVTKLHVTTTTFTDPNTPPKIVKSIQPVSQLNLNKQRITERDLESVTKKNSTSSVTSNSKSRENPIIPIQPVDQPVDLSTVCAQTLINHEQPLALSKKTLNEIQKFPQNGHQSAEHDALLIQILKTQLKKEERQCELLDLQIQALESTTNTK